MDAEGRRPRPVSVSPRHPSVSQDQGGGRALPEALYETALDLMPSNGRLLNLGCGTVLRFEELASKRGLGPMTSVDITTPPAPPLNVRFLEADVTGPLHLDGEFDVVTFFELIEHVDQTDELLRNCWHALRPGGRLVCSFPNLASLYGRLELLLGLQPHVLEVSNVDGRLGSGLPGRMNNPTGDSIHHIRGITQRAMCELLRLHGFEVTSIRGFAMGRPRWLGRIPSIAPQNIVACDRLD